MLAELCPAPPDWRVDWPALVERFDWVAAMVGVPQDRNYHREGDVATHTRMVLEVLAGSAGFRALPPGERALVFTAALMHDIGKPACTRPDEHGGYTSLGHSRRGEHMARRILWRLGASFAEREQVAALVRFHEAPFFVIDDEDCQRRVYAISQAARCDHLAILAAADGRGRDCRDPADRHHIVDNAALFAEYCLEHDCASKPREFVSDLARYQYFHKVGRDPDYAPHDDTWGEAIVMAGLPGVGKDYWIERNCADYEVVSLDEIRAELGIAAGEPQGRVVAEGRARARRVLRAQRPLVWNATNLSRKHRQGLVGLFADYRARVRIVYLEVDEELLRRRNRERADPVPGRVIERMIDKWTVPDLTEAHIVDCHVDDE